MDSSLQASIFPQIMAYAANVAKERQSAIQKRTWTERLENLEITNMEVLFLIPYSLVQKIRFRGPVYHCFLPIHGRPENFRFPDRSFLISLAEKV